MLGRIDTRSETLPCFNPACSCACSCACLPQHLVAWTLGCPLALVLAWMFLLACPRCFLLASHLLRSLCGCLTCWMFRQFPACLSVLACFDADSCDCSNVLIDWIPVFLASTIAQFLRCFDHQMLGCLDTRSDTLPRFDPACSPNVCCLDNWTFLFNACRFGSANRCEACSLASSMLACLLDN